MGAPSLDMAKQLLRLIDFEFARIVDGATRAVVQAVVTIDFGVGAREQLLRPLRLCEFLAVLQRGHFRGRQRRRELVREVFEHGWDYVGV